MAFTDYHYYPTAISQTSPIIVALSAHGLSNGQRVRFTNMVAMPSTVATGMEQLNNGIYQVQGAEADSFLLYDLAGRPVDGTSYTAFVNNGLASFTLVGPELYYENEPS